MNTQSEILIHAPREAIFESVADLSRWPAVLPHYRFITYLKRGADRHIVKMAAHRDGIPISWVSEQIIDREVHEVRFRHLRAFTQGMAVVWQFDEKPEGTLVRIVHVLDFRVRLVAPIAERIIGEFFIDNIAGKTLRMFKTHLESRSA